MMNKVLIAIIFSLSLFFVSCSHNHREDVSEIHGYDDEPLLNGVDIHIGCFEIVDLEMTKESVIDYILRIECIDSIILVQTPDMLFAFSRGGRFICRFGNHGKGPFEYLRLSSFVVDRFNKVVRIIDGASCRIIAFSLDGKGLSEKRYDNGAFTATETWSAKQLPSNQILFTNSILNDKHSLYTLFDIEKNSNKVLYDFPLKTDNTEENTGVNTVSIFNDTIKLLLPFCNMVYSLNNGRLFPILRVLSEQRIVSSKQISSIENFSINTYAEFMNNGHFAGFTSIYETGNYMFLEVMFNLNYFLVDKRSSTGRLFEYGISEGHHVLPLINIKGVDSGRLIGVGEPRRLLGLKEDMSIETDDMNVAKLKKHLENFSIDSNPCLFFYEIL